MADSSAKGEGVAHCLQASAKKYMFFTGGGRAGVPDMSQKVGDFLLLPSESPFPAQRTHCRRSGVIAVGISRQNPPLGIKLEFKCSFLTDGPEQEGGERVRTGGRGKKR